MGQTKELKPLDGLARIWVSLETAANEASPVLPGDQIGRQHTSTTRTVGQWLLALQLLTPVTGQALRGRTPPRPAPTPCSMTSYQRVRGIVGTSPRWKQPNDASPEASSNSPGSIQTEYSGALREAKWYRGLEHRPGSLTTQA